MGAASWLLPLVLCRTTAARKLPDSPKLARSGEAVAWNSLCKRYEHQKPVDARGVGSGAVAVFVHARDVSSYCGRVIDLLNSWAPRFPHAYAILRNNTLDDGAGARETAAAFSRSCELVDAQRDPMPRRGVKGPHRWRLMRCGEAGVRPIALAMHCRGAPCCRANVALRLFLDRSANRFQMVKWWVFADETTYVKPGLLLGALARIDPEKGAALYEAAAGGDPVARACPGALGDRFLAAVRPQAFTVFSRGALLAMGPGVHAMGLQRQCEALGLGHAAGFSLYAWSHGVDALRLKRDAVLKRDVPVAGYAGLRDADAAADQGDPLACAVAEPAVGWACSAAAGRRNGARPAEVLERRDCGASLSPDCPAARAPAPECGNPGPWLESRAPKGK